MAKDLNSFTKRQPELEKRPKADEKRERRSKKEQKTDEFVANQMKAAMFVISGRAVRPECFFGST